jgi:hypothetical protein
MTVRKRAYDPAAAAALLDRLIRQARRPGLCLRPDGKPLTVTLTIHRQCWAKSTLPKKNMDTLGVRFDFHWFPCRTFPEPAQGKS